MRLVGGADYAIQGERIAWNKAYEMRRFRMQRLRNPFSAHYLLLIDW